MAQGNPFLHRGPIRDPAYFYGRRTEIKQALALLQRAQSVSIVGPRRIGKSSLLFQLANPAVVEQHDLRSEACCFVYVACESWSSLTQNEFFGLFLQEMKEALVKASHTVDFTLPATEATTYRALDQAIRTVVSQSIRLIFMLDEFEALSTNPQLDVHFFSALRGLTNRHRVAFITASTEMLYDLTYIQTTVLSSPFFNFFAQIRLHPFLSTEAKEMLHCLAAKGGISFSPATITFLYDLAGPHPCLLQLAGYHAFEIRARQAGPLTEVDLAQVRRQFLVEAEPHWRYFWHKLTTEEQRALALLPAASQPALTRLLTTGLVVSENGGFTLLSPAFREFVNRQPIDGVLQAPPVTIDRNRQLVLLHGQPLHLSPIPFNLLVCLVEQANQVIPHQALELAVWPENGYCGDPDRLRKAVQALRQALNDESGCVIENVRGVGYRFVAVQ